jgi:hypothetical protein
VAVAVEYLHELPNRMIYGPFYVKQSREEIEEILAFLEIRADQAREREEARHYR